MSEPPLLIVLAGPTATGKTGTGVVLADALNGEIISADARQVYRHMDIGTAKPRKRELEAAPHHLIDVVNPDVTYNAGRYAREAAAAVDGVVSRGRFPILVGGAGFYLEALLKGFSPIPEIPPDVRAVLQERARMDLGGLYRRLKEVDPRTAARLNGSDRQRIVRALEVHEATGETLSNLQALPRITYGRWRVKSFGLTMDRTALYRRIEVRVEKMIETGLIEEAVGLREMGYGPELNALNIFGYRETFAYLDGRLKLDEAVEQMKIGTRRYAKRQMTWFRRDREIAWIDPTTQDASSQILRSLNRG